MTRQELIELLEQADSQPQDGRFELRLNDAQRQMIAKLAQVYSMSMAQVLIHLAYQGIIDWVQDGECMALVKD